MDNAQLDNLAEKNLELAAQVEILKKHLQAFSSLSTQDDAVAWEDESERLATLPPEQCLLEFEAQTAMSAFGFGYSDGWNDSALDNPYNGNAAAKERSDLILNRKAT